MCAEISLLSVINADSTTQIAIFDSPCPHAARMMLKKKELFGDFLET